MNCLHVSIMLFDSSYWINCIILYYKWKWLYCLSPIQLIVNWPRLSRNQKLSNWNCLQTDPFLLRGVFFASFRSDLIPLFKSSNVNGCVLFVITTVATRGGGTAFPSGLDDLILVFTGVRSLFFCVVFCRSLLFFVVLFYLFFFDFRHYFKIRRQN